MGKFENGLYRHSLSYQLHNGGNEIFEAFPCWRKIGYWRPMEPPELCDALVDTYNMMRNNEEKLK